MLIILASWLLIALTTTTVGWVWWMLLRRWGVAGNPLPLELLSLSGMAVLIMLLQPLSLVAPIGTVTQILFGLSILLLSCWHWKSLWAVVGEAFSGRPVLVGWLAGGLFGLIVLQLLLRISAGDYNPDAELYYLQSLQWIERFRAVPGLGNLHGRLAFNLSIFLPTALYRVPTPTGAYYPLPSYLLVLLAGTSVRGLVRFCFSPAPKNWWPWVPMLSYFFLIHFFQRWLASPAPDYALFVILTFIFLHYTPFWNCGIAPPTEQTVLLLVLLSVVAVTIKLSALPVLLLPAHAVWLYQRTKPQTRLLRRALLLSGILFGPWLLRSALLSGYLLFPLPALDVLPVDWKIPGALVETERRLILNIARQLYRTQRPLSMQQWFPGWWDWQQHDLLGASVLVLAVIAPLVVLWRWLQTGLLNTRPRTGWLVAAIGCLFWFTTAPDIRFGLSFLVVAACWPWLTLPVPTRGYGLAMTVALSMLVLGWALQSLRDPVYTMRHGSQASTHVLWPALQPLPPTTPVVVDGHVLHLAQQHGACGSTPIPCSYYQPVGLQFRGASLVEGFRIQADTSAPASSRFRSRSGSPR